MTSNQPSFDVAVVGAGNAALCAALSARDSGASVVVLEKAPHAEQGGNCPFTAGGFRFVHGGIGDLLSLLPDLSPDQAGRIQMAPYTAENFRQHLLTVTRGDTTPELMETVISQSRSTIEWMHAKGVRWELSRGHRESAGAPSVIPSSVGLSAWRSGLGLVRMLTTAARRAGVTIVYETEMVELMQGEGGEVRGVVARDARETYRIESGAVVLACGGFEANASMRGQHIGPGWERAKVRGSRHNTGDGHRVALDIGAQPFGQWNGCHATPVDVDSPATGDLQLTDLMPRRSYPLGITVNQDGRRFVDEGEGFAEQTFVNMGHAILKQRDTVAHQIFDARAIPHLEARYSSARRVEAPTIRQLAQKIGLKPAQLERTVMDFNARAHQGEYDPRHLDGRTTTGLEPPKSNWAIKIDTPPFVAFTVTVGITYTYGGIKIDTSARVLDTENSVIPGLYAAGEIVGGIFYHNSLRAVGLMHGSVFGRIAGQNASERAAQIAVGGPAVGVADVG